jgi:hypothetical protein
MAEQLRGPFEKFVDWRQRATVMLLCLPLPVHELSKWTSYLYSQLQIVHEQSTLFVYYFYVKRGD